MAERPAEAVRLAEADRVAMLEAARVAVPGGQGPTGFWDPAALTPDGRTRDLAPRRPTEPKHGRVSMMAIMSCIDLEATGRLPRCLSPPAGLECTDIPHGLGADSEARAACWTQIMAYGVLCDFFAADDHGWEALTSRGDAENQSQVVAEIENTRRAMMAITGIIPPALWAQVV